REVRRGEPAGLPGGLAGASDPLMSRAIGINPWVWASPLTDETVTDLLHHVAALGFDAVELPLETSGDLSPEVVGAALEATGLKQYVVGEMAAGQVLHM